MERSSSYYHTDASNKSRIRVNRTAGIAPEMIYGMRNFN